LALAPTSGDVLVLAFANTGPVDGPTAVKQVSYITSISEVGVTWKLAFRRVMSVASSEVWVGEVGSGASTAITVDLNGAIVGEAIADVCEYSGVSTVVDKTASTYGGSVMHTKTGTTAQLTYPVELEIGAIGSSGEVAVQGDYPSTNPTNGFTLLDGTYINFPSPTTGPWVASLAYLEKIATTGGTASSGTTAGRTNYAGIMVSFPACSEISVCSTSTNPTSTST
jgi:hypothetical protein